MRTKRVTFSLPEELADRIALVARAMGVSQSALLVSVTSEAFQHMSVIVGELELAKDVSTVKRLRGKSIEEVERLYREFIEHVEGEGRAVQ